MRKKILFISLFVLIILSFNALAAVPSPSDAFSGLGDFFTGLFTGSTNSDNLYLLTVLLYFIVLMVIFFEGVRMLPLFGRAGEINGPGKWFAGAAAGLATIGIFVAEHASGKSAQDLLVGLLAPFGVYGGFAIAGLLAWMAFHTLSNMDFFKEKTVTAMAFAGAIGLSVAGYILSMDTLLGWSYLLLLIVFLAGIIPSVIGAFSNRDKGSSSYSSPSDRSSTTSTSSDISPSKQKKKQKKAKKKETKTVKKAEKATETEEKWALREYQLLKATKELLDSGDPKKVYQAAKKQNSFKRILKRLNQYWKRSFKNFKKLEDTSKNKEARALNREIKMYFQNLLKVLESDFPSAAEKILNTINEEGNFKKSGKPVENSGLYTAPLNKMKEAVDKALEWDTAFIQKIRELEKMAKVIEKADQIEEE